MDKFLLIHTSLKKAFVAISEGKEVISVKFSELPREHSSFLHPAISDILTENNWDSNNITAIGVTGGPGSYTGIRVGMSAAKGLGYAWNKPLIVCSNLMALAATASDKLKEKAIYIPVIHARQKEYYMGFYDENQVIIQPDVLRVLHKEDHTLWPEGKKLIFGTGLEKLKEEIGFQPLINLDEIDTGSFARLILKLFFYENMTDAENAAPVYLKDVYIRKG